MLGLSRVANVLSSALSRAVHAAPGRVAGGTALHGGAVRSRRSVFPGAGLGSRCLCGRDSRPAQKGDAARSPFTSVREPEETGSERPVLVPVPDVSPRPSRSLWRDPKAEGPRREPGLARPLLEPGQVL